MSKGRFYSDDDLHEAGVAFHVAYEASVFDEPLGAILDGLRAAIPVLPPQQTATAVSRETLAFTIWNTTTKLERTDADAVAEAVLSLLSGGEGLGSRAVPCQEPRSVQGLAERIAPMLNRPGDDAWARGYRCAIADVLDLIPPPAEPATPEPSSTGRRENQPSANRPEKPE